MVSERHFPLSEAIDQFQRIPIAVATRERPWVKIEHTHIGQMDPS